MRELYREAARSGQAEVEVENKAGDPETLRALPRPARVWMAGSVWNGHTSCRLVEWSRGSVMTHPDDALAVAALKTLAGDIDNVLSVSKDGLQDAMEANGIEKVAVGSLMARSSPG